MQATASQISINPILINPKFANKPQPAQDERRDIILVSAGSAMNHPMVQQYFECRQREFVERKRWEDVTDVDRFDEHADFILLAQHQQFLIGCRIIHRSRSGTLPAQDYIAQPIHEDSREISRMVSKSERTSRYAFLLYGAIVQYLVERNVPQTIMMLRKRYWEMFTRRNCLIFEPLAGSSMSKGADEFLPAHLNMGVAKEYFQIDN